MTGNAVGPILANFHARCREVNEPWTCAAAAVVRPRAFKNPSQASCASQQKP